MYEAFYKLREKPFSILPDPDLIIRTGGEMRLSNYLIWQAAYAEYYSSPRLWPDFDHDDFVAALDAFSARKRRFGKTDAQIAQESQESQVSEESQQLPPPAQTAQQTTEQAAEQPAQTSQPYATEGDGANDGA